MTELKTTWTILKATMTARGLTCQWFDQGASYFVAVFDKQLEFTTEIEKDGGADQIDFETNYKTGGNGRLEDPKDTDGSPIQRMKTTKSGWHFEPRSMDFFTSKAGSLYNRAYNTAQILTGTDLGDGVLSFFNASAVAMTQNIAGGETLAAFQARLDALDGTGCVETYADWEPNYSFDLVGAYFQIVSPPPASNPAYLWVIIAPDVPANLGGSVPFCNGGWNLAFFGDRVTFDVDAKGVKSFNYDPVYHSGKIRLLIKHDPGVKIGIQIIYKQYKA